MRRIIEKLDWIDVSYYIGFAAVLAFLYVALRIAVS